MSWVTVYGMAALTYMMAMYWLEHRGPVFTLGFGLGCLWSSISGSSPEPGRSGRSKLPGV